MKRFSIASIQAFVFGAVSEPVTTRNLPFLPVSEAMMSASALPTAANVAWLMNTERASLATSESQALIFTPACSASWSAGASESGSLAATEIASHWSWTHCWMYCTCWTAAASVGPLKSSSTSSSRRVTRAPRSVALKSGMPTSFGITQIFAPALARRPEVGGALAHAAAGRGERGGEGERDATRLIRPPRARGRPR